MKVGKVEIWWGAKGTAAVHDAEGATDTEKGKKQVITSESPLREDKSSITSDFKNKSGQIS